MSPEYQQPNSENTNAELAFVQQALAAADRSERSSRIIVGVLAILASRRLYLDAPPHVPARNPGRTPAFTPSRRPFLPGPPVRHHHVPSSGHEQEHPHHPPGPRQHPPALTSSQTKRGRRAPPSLYISGSYTSVVDLALVCWVVQGLNIARRTMYRSAPIEPSLGN